MTEFIHAPVGIKAEMYLPCASLIMLYTMKTYRREVIAPSSLPSALDGGERSESKPAALYPEKAPRYLLIKGLVGPQNWSGSCNVSKVK
jgi:hypothetical protein